MSYAETAITLIKEKITFKQEERNVMELPRNKINQMKLQTS